MLDGLTDHDELEEKGIVEQRVFLGRSRLTSLLKMPANSGDRVFDVAQALLLVAAGS